MRTEPCPGRVLVSVLVVALSLSAVLVAGACLSVARASKALMMPGCGVGNGGVDGGLPHGRVPRDLDVEHGEQLGLKVGGQLVQVAGDFGQQTDQVQIIGGYRVGGQLSQLGCDGLVFGVQGGVVGADAAAVFLSGVVGHVEGAA